MTYREHILNGTAVETISNEVQEYLTGLNTESQSKQRMRLTIEELLLSVMDHGGTVVKVGIGKQFGRHVFRLKYEMEPYDPTKGAEDEWVGNMMRSLGFFPSWSCYGRRNTVSLILADRPKRSMLFYIVLAVIASVLLGFLGDGIPSSLREEIRNALLLPIANGFLGLLKTFSGIMICLAICSGVLGMGDTTTLGRTGRSVLTRFLVISFLISALSTVIVFPFLNLSVSTGARGHASTVSQISQMLFGVLPSNPIEPFQTGNTLQLTVIAIIVGVGLLAVGERGRHVRVLVEESFALMQHIVSAICALIPVFIFSMILNQIWSGHGEKFLHVLKPLLLLALTVSIIAVLLWIASSIYLKCSPLTLLKKTFPAFLIAFTTASSISALPFGMETCEKKLGIHKNLVSFAYPLGSVIFMPASVAYFTVILCSFAEIYEIEVSVAWLIMAIVTATLIAIAMPPIPEADVLCYSILFSTLGIPAEGIVLATAIGIIVDYFDTGFNVLLMIFQLTCEAKHLDNLDHDALINS